MKRIFTLLSLLLIVCGGCNGRSSAIRSTERTTPRPQIMGNGTTESTDATITLTMAVEEPEREHYQRLIDQFTREHSNIRVRLISVSEAATTEGEEPIKTLASSADIFPYNPNLQTGKQYLLDLQPLIEADADFNQADFQSGILPHSGEATWSIPVGVRYPLIYYNKIAFDRAGIPAPQPSWRDDEFLAIAQQLTLSDGDEVVQWGFVPNQLRYLPLISAQLERPLSAVDSADENVVHTIEWVGDLFTEHKVTPWLESYKPFAQQTMGDAVSPASLQTNGKAAMWAATHVIYNADDTSVGVTAVPQAAHGYSADAVPVGFALSRGTQHADAAWDLLRFLSHQPPANTFSQPLVPARQSVLHAINYWEQLPSPLTVALQYATTHNSTPRLSNPDDFTTIHNALVAYILEGKSAEVALAQAEPSDNVEIETPSANIVVPEATVADAQEQITFMMPGSVDTDRLRSLVRRFEQEQQPDFSIRLTRREYDYDTAQFEPIVDVDCFVEEAPSTIEEMGTSLVPLNALLELDGSLDEASFYPALLASVMLRGDIIGIPAFASIPHLEYNKSLFAGAGVPPPSLDWTLDDFLTTAQQLTTNGTPESKQYGYADWLSQLFYYGYQLFAVETVRVDENGVPLYDFQAAAPMLKWNADLIRTYQVQPLLANELRSEAGRELFEALVTNERVAMWPAVATSIMRATDKFPEDIEIGIAPFPQGVQGGINLASYAYFILDRTSNREACWQWIEFLVKQPEVAAYLPAYIPTAESDTYTEMIGSEAADLYRAVAANSTPTISTPPSVPPWLWFGSQLLHDAYIAAASDEQDVQSALSGAEAKFNRYRQCVIDNDAFMDRAQQERCSRVE